MTIKSFRSTENGPTEGPAGSIHLIDHATILTPTGGFLKSGFTHSLNAYQGCAFAGSLCGIFCYAQHNQWITRGRAWGLYGAKRDVRSAYEADYDRIKRPKQEKRLRLTWSILDAMRTRPPDVLVIQSHHTLIERDIDLITDLSSQFELWVSLTVETDRESIPGFPPHASSPARRLETLQRFRARGVSTQATLSPLLPLADPTRFARQLASACDRVILDHYLIGDGSPNGWRTRRTTLAERLDRAGFAAWNELAKFWEIRDLFYAIMGRARVCVGVEGFNSVGQSICT
jgi:hypothetical protein